jgi:hypothetical protein
MKPWHLVLFNLLFILFITGFAWTFFMIVFVMFGVFAIAGNMFANALDKL